MRDGSRIVIYDDSPLKSAARAWWLLKLFGAHDVALLDGGLAKWKAEGRPLEMGKQTLRGERAFNKAAGIGQGADDLPDFFRSEPLPPHEVVFDIPKAELDKVFNF